MQGQHVEDDRMSVMNTFQMRYRIAGKKLARVALVLLVSFCLTALTGWGVLAIYYGDSHSSLLQTVLAGGFGLTSCVTLIGI
jgi:hypothetical protein